MSRTRISFSTFLILTVATALFGFHTVGFAVCPAPTFFPMRSYFIDSVQFPGYLHISDINNDARPDLIMGEPLTGGATTMTVMLGTGSIGGMQHEQNYTIGGFPKDITSADVNNDGFNDVIVSQWGPTEIFLGTPSGLLGPPIYYNPAGAAPNHISTTVAADLNSDGNVDLVFFNTYNYSILVRFGNGNGTFNNTQDISVGVISPSKMYLVDVNNDGRNDLVVPTNVDSSSRILFGTMNGTFGPPVTTSGLHYYGLRFQDLNGDGFKDAITASSSVYVNYNNGGTGFSPAVATSLQLPAGRTAGYGRMEDFDGDGILDAVVITNVPDIRVYKGFSLTSFGPPLIWPLTYSAYGLDAADLNNDGMMDFAAVGYDSSSAYTFINNCGWTLPTYTITGSISNSEGYGFVARVDLNSPEAGTFSTFGSTAQNFVFDGLPPGNYTVTPTHSLFNFFPPTITINQLNSDVNIAFQSTIRKFRVYGNVSVSGTSGQVPATGMPMRFVGPFDGLTGEAVGSAPFVDILVYTDASGNYSFEGILPIPGTQFYQIQFQYHPIFQSITPIQAVRGLSADRILNFVATRRLYNFGVRLRNANGEPRPGMLYTLLQPQGFPERSFITDANGEGMISNLQAGLRHQIYEGVPSYRFAPRWPVADPLSENTQVNVRVSRRNLSDFDDDGRSDIAVWRPENGVWYITNSATGSFSIVPFGLPTDIPVNGDFDGDEKAEIAVFRPSDGTWHMLLSRTNQYSAVPFGLIGDIPLPTDFDRDGRADMAVYRPSTGVWYHYNSYYQTVEAVRWGTEEDIPLTGDFDGDTYYDRVVYRPSNQTWYLLTANWNRAIRYGAPGDKVLTGDFDGDTISDIAVWRPSTGAWYIFNLVNESSRTELFGLQGDEPLAGDFDGDGIDDLAVFRPSEGNWYVLRSSDRSLYVARFGLQGDRPIPGFRAR